jgi:hypothetical protein
MLIEGATANVVDRLGVDRQCARGHSENAPRGKRHLDQFLFK